MTPVLPRTNLNEHVYETLKRRLVRRDLRAGEKVSLHELAAGLGGSRSPRHHAPPPPPSPGPLSGAGAGSLDGTRFRDRNGFDATNAAFHEFQIDLAGNHLISAFYRELPVMLLMQVIRGGRAEAGPDLSGEHRRIVEAYEAGAPAAARAA